MNLTIYRILFFCLVPLGLFILFKTIRMLKGVFNGKVITEFRFSQASAKFSLNDAGIYSIWHKGKLFRSAPLDRYKLKLVNESSGEEIRMSSSIFSPTLNDFETSRMELLRFDAPAGNYHLSIEEGSSLSVLGKIFGKLLPATPVDPDQYFIQVRETKPVYYMIASIPLFIICAFFVIGGIVAGFIAPQLLQAAGIPFQP